MRIAVFVTSIGALLFDLIAIGASDTSGSVSNCVFLGWFLVPLSALLGAIYIGNGGSVRGGWWRGLWVVVLVLLAGLAVFGAIHLLDIILRCFDLYGSSCQEPSPSETMQAHIVFVASVVASPLVALISALLPVPGPSVTKAPRAEAAVTARAEDAAVEPEPPTDAP